MTLLRASVTFTKESPVGRPISMKVQPLRRTKIVFLRLVIFNKMDAKNKNKMVLYSLWLVTPSCWDTLAPTRVVLSVFSQWIILVWPWAKLNIMGQWHARCFFTPGSKVKEKGPIDPSKATYLLSSCRIASPEVSTTSQLVFNTWACGRCFKFKAEQVWFYKSFVIVSYYCSSMAV